MDTDVLIVGAGPTGLMLACELGLAGVQTLVLERGPRLQEASRGSGLAGRIVELMRYRGLLDRVEAALDPIAVTPRLPFGGVHVDFSSLGAPPMPGLMLPPPQLERLLDERARELGAEVRHGHKVVGLDQDLTQDEATATAEVRGPNGLYRVITRYLVGCDGAHSQVRAAADIPFPGTAYPEVNRLGQFTVPISVKVLSNGELDVPGLGRVRANFIRTDHGVFGIGSSSPGLLGIQTTEDGLAEVDDDAPVTLAEFQDSIRRVLGIDIPLGDPIRLSRFQFQARQADRYRDRQVLLAGDAAHVFPAPGVGLGAGMLDAANLAWKLAAAIHGCAPAGLLDTYHEERHFAGARTMLHTQAQVALRRGTDGAADALRHLFLELLADEQPLRRIGSLIAGSDIRYPLPNSNQHALTGGFVPDLALHTARGTTSVAELMHAARPIFVDLADRPELREVARDWRHRIDIHTAANDGRPADAVLIRPDAYVAWAAMGDEPADTAALGLREACSYWFGAPRECA